MLLRSSDPNLNPLEEQTVVIAGASSGIGLTTARTAADRGARVVVAARSGDALREAVADSSLYTRLRRSRIPTGVAATAAYAGYRAVRGR